MAQQQQHHHQRLPEAEVEAQTVAEMDAHLQHMDVMLQAGPQAQAAAPSWWQQQQHPALSRQQPSFTRSAASWPDNDGYDAKSSTYLMRQQQQAGALGLAGLHSASTSMPSLGLPQGSRRGPSLLGEQGGLLGSGLDVRQQPPLLQMQQPGGWAQGGHGLRQQGAEVAVDEFGMPAGLGLSDEEESDLGVTVPARLTPLGLAAQQQQPQLGWGGGSTLPAGQPQQLGAGHAGALAAGILGKRTFEALRRAPGRPGGAGAMAGSVQEDTG